MNLTRLSHQQRKHFLRLSLQKKVALAEDIIKQTFEEFPTKKCAIAWTGGKDSTLLLWLIKNECLKNNLELPYILVIDEGDMFPEIMKFIRNVEKVWEFKAKMARNANVLSQVNKIGDRVEVGKLNKRNKTELDKLGYLETTFLFEPESLVGNHLMKTVATNMWLEKNNIAVLFTGVRWDEQKARSVDNFHRLIDDPRHTRVEPILHFSEKDVWETTHQHNIPYSSLYEKGYRSLGAKSTTSKFSNKPAWKQDSKTIKERAGRQQDKEKIMKRLRDLGYM